MASKAESLGRLPTKDDIRADPKLPSLAEIAVTYEDRSVEAMLAKLARLLYKRGIKPVDLSTAELALTPTERVQKEREYLEFYRARLAKVKEPGGIKQLQREQQRAWEEPKIPEGAVIRRIPTKTLEERRRERQALGSKEARRAWNSAGLESVEAAQRRVSWSLCSKSTETEKQPAAQSLSPNADEDEIKKVVENVVKKIADDVVIAAVLQLKEQLGDFPSQRQVFQYKQQHPDAKMPSWPVLVRVLGPDRKTWQAQIDARKGDSVSAGAETGVPEVAPPAPEVVMPNSATKIQGAETTKVLMKVNMPVVTVDVQLNGKSYQVQVEFGTAGSDS